MFICTYLYCHVTQTKGEVRISNVQCFHYLLSSYKKIMLCNVGKHHR